jgi:hypothetical protein
LLEDKPEDQAGIVLLGGLRAGACQFSDRISQTGISNYLVVRTNFPMVRTIFLMVQTTAARFAPRSTPLAGSIAVLQDGNYRGFHVPDLPGRAA